MISLERVKNESNKPKLPLEFKQDSARLVIDNGLYPPAGGGQPERPGPLVQGRARRWSAKS